MRKVTISRKRYRDAVAANKRLTSLWKHLPQYLRPKYVALVGKTTIQFAHREPGEYDPHVRPEVPVRNIQNTRQKTLAINPGYVRRAGRTGMGGVNHAISQPVREPSRKGLPPSPRTR